MSKARCWCPACRLLRLDQQFLICPRKKLDIWPQGDLRHVCIYHSSSKCQLISISYQWSIRCSTCVQGVLVQNKLWGSGGTWNFYFFPWAWLALFCRHCAEVYPLLHPALNTDCHPVVSNRTSLQQPRAFAHPKGEILRCWEGTGKSARFLGSCQRGKGCREQMRRPFLLEVLWMCFCIINKNPSDFHEWKLGMTQTMKCPWRYRRALGRHRN